MHAAGGTVRKALRAIGLHSVSRHDSDLLSTVKRELFPPGGELSSSYVPERTLGHDGFSMNHDQQIALLESFGDERFQHLFRRLRQNEGINSGFDGTDYKARNLIHNGFFPTPDAEAYASMIMKFLPEQIIEIGSGYSTLIAKTTVDHVGMSCKIRVIDPQPRRSVESVADEVEYKRVEESALSRGCVAPGSILFIDSSHVCRRGGDIPFLYCNLLPNLSPGVLVHVHDIFTPYDYPDAYVGRFYVEQYLLNALLANSEKFEVVLSTHYLSRCHAGLMQKVFGPEVGRDSLFFGASFWMLVKS